MGQPSLTNMGGMMMMTAPDVCNVSTPAGPVPTPFPNTGQGSTLVPSKLTKKVKVCKAPAAHLGSETAISSGDEAGTLLGVTSGKIVGPIKFTQGSTKVRLEGKGAVRMGDPTQHNGGNTVGMVSAPSQSKVLMG